MQDLDIYLFAYCIFGKLKRSETKHAGKIYKLLWKLLISAKVRLMLLTTSPYTRTVEARKIRYNIAYIYENKKSTIRQQKINSNVQISVITFHAKKFVNSAENFAKRVLK